MRQKKRITALKGRKLLEVRPIISKKSKSVSTEKKIDLILKKLDYLEKGQKKLEREEKQLISSEESIMNLEKKEISEESVIEHNEKEELDELKKIEDLEKNIKEGLKESPLKRVTYKDISKGILGAFFGIIGHFAFVEGTHISEEFSFLRSTMLLVTSFVIILIFLYFSGFRKIKDRLVFEFLPIRAVVIFLSSILTVFFVLLIYGMIGADTSFMHIYNSVAAISILAVIGAATADLIGKNE